MTAHAERLRARAFGAHATGTLGVVLGLLAFLLAIPPFTARSPIWPVVVGVLAVAAGVWTVTRGRKRLGWWAVASGLLGIALGILATRSSTGNLNTVFRADLIASMLVFATPLTFAAIGGMVSERSGVVNVGLEGMMLMGAFWGVYGADKTGSWLLGILIAMASGGLMAAVHALFSVHLRADQIVSGMAMNFLALGITGYFFTQLYNGNNVPINISTIPNVRLPLVHN
jgi:general nucleoside transport system permease protein